MDTQESSCEKNCPKSGASDTGSDTSNDHLPVRGPVPTIEVNQLRMVREHVTRTDSEKTFRSEAGSSSGSGTSDHFRRRESLEESMAGATLEIQRKESADSVAEDNASALLDEDFLCPAVPVIVESITDADDTSSRERSCSKDRLSCSDTNVSQAAASQQPCVIVADEPHTAIMSTDDRGPSVPLDATDHSTIANGRTLSRQ